MGGAEFKIVVGSKSFVVWEFMRTIINSKRFWQTLTIGLLTVFVLNQTSPNLLQPKSSKSNPKSFALVGTAQASEIYPMFTCPCCGEPLNKEEPCCGMMTQMIDYIDQQVSLGGSKDEIVLATAKEFGLDRLTKEEDRQALKQKLADLAPADAPKIEISEVSRDLGTVSQNQGVITTDFEFKNVGFSDLVIYKLSSSCGCTSAAIVYEGSVGPTFTMAGHGQENPTDWKVAIKPEDSAVLQVFYDPTVHPDLEGAVTRTVSIFSNDVVEFEKKVTITLEQTK